LTASMAYSIWKMRPWGLQVVTSVSYCTTERKGQRRRKGGPFRRAVTGAARPVAQARHAYASISVLRGMPAAIKDFDEVLAWLRNIAAA
jgi:hypothetical protein